MRGASDQSGTTDATREVVPFFPDARPDEHLHSLITRYRRQSMRTSRAVSHSLFGVPRYSMWLDAPLGLEAFCSAMPQGLMADPWWVVRQLTPFNYMTAYMPPHTRAAMMAGMLSRCRPGNRNRPNRRVLVPLAQGLRHCPACLEEDLASSSGEAYWRRSHQLPSVLVCIRHRIPLVPTGILTGRGTIDFEPFPARIAADGPMPAGSKVADEVEPLLVELAVASETLLHRTTATTDTMETIEGYRRRARELGFVRMGRMDNVALALSFSDTMKPAMKEFPLLAAADGHPSWWLAEFMRGGAKIAHIPLLHLLVGCWLARAAPLPSEDARLHDLRRSRVVSKGRGAIANWRDGSHDAALAARLPEAAARLFARTPPVRVTRSEIAKAIGVTTLSRTVAARQHLPISTRVVEELAEPLEAFFQRRLAYELDRMQFEGKPLRLHDVLKRMGRRNRHDDVRLAIAKRDLAAGS